MGEKKRRKRRNDSSHGNGPDLSSELDFGTLVKDSEVKVRNYYAKRGLQPQGIHAERIARLDRRLAHLYAERKEVVALQRDFSASASKGNKRKLADLRVKEEVFTDHILYLRSERTCLMPPEIVQDYDSDFRRMYQAIDTSRSGTISYTELLDYFDLSRGERNNDLHRVLASRAFKKADWDNQGAIAGWEVLIFYLKYCKYVVQEYGKTFRGDMSDPLDDSGEEEVEQLYTRDPATGHYVDAGSRKPVRMGFPEEPAPAPPPPRNGSGPGTGAAWTQGQQERPAGTKNMGTWTAAVFTAEQQARLGVDEYGQPVEAYPSANSPYQPRGAEDGDRSPRVVDHRPPPASSTKKSKKRSKKKSKTKRAPVVKEEESSDETPPNLVDSDTTNSDDSSE